MTVISDFEPQYRLDVEWPTDESASLGNTLDPEKLQDAPTVSLAGPLFIDGTSLAGMTHVLAVTDPDAPSRDNPKWSEFCHWIASGLTVPGADTTTGGKAVPEHVIMSYKPPGPPPGTGKHRYVFLVLVPRNSTTDALHLTKPSGRQRWGYDEKGRGVRDWADENGLIPVGKLKYFDYQRFRHEPRD